MTVGGHHRCEGVVDQPPALALHLRAVAAEQAAAVDLERQGRRNMWRRVQQSGPPLESVARQRKTLGDGLNAVVSGRHHVRVNVYEAGLHPVTVASRKATATASRLLGF